MTVYYSIELDTAITACNSFEWNEVLYTESGTYNYQSTTSNSCDSTAVLYLTLGQTDTLNYEYSAFDSYEWNDSIYTESGVYTNITTTQYGCDSISILDLTIYNLETNFDEQESICLGDNINLQLLNIASENQFETSVNDELIISEFLSYTGPSSFTSPYLEPGNYYLKVQGTWCIGNCFNGHTVDAAFNFNDPYIQNLPIEFEKTFTWNEYCPQGDNSCESFRPTPDIYNPDHVYYYPFISEGGSETIYGINDECCWSDNQSGLTFEIYKSNSIINSYLQADVTWSTGETTDSINVSPTSTTLYVVTVELDSLTYVDTVNVVVLETDTFFDNHSACYEYEWNGEIYTESGIYNYETTSVNGCDSVAILDLTINNSGESIENILSCDSYEWNDSTYTVSGVYTFDTTTINGCDSVATLNLTINYSDSSSVIFTECDSYEWNGNVYTESGVYTYNTSTVNGCDSVAILNLTINNSDESAVSITVCIITNGTELLIQSLAHILLIPLLLMDVIV